MDTTAPTLAEVKAAIAKLPREDRAILRPWLLARYDVRGYEERGYVGTPRRTNAAHDGSTSAPDTGGAR